MNQFRTILKFELSHFMKSKSFVGITIAIIIISGIVLSFPRITSIFNFDSETDSSTTSSGQDGDTSKMLLNSDEATYEFFSSYFSKLGYTIEKSDLDEDGLKKIVDAEDSEYSDAVIIVSPTEYKHIVKNTTLYDSFTQYVDQALKAKYQHDSILALGGDEKAAADIMNVEIKSETIQTGKSQQDTFFYTYILIFVLYMAILLYGQMVASSVATEKSSRAMEVLITSAKPMSLMFGKVIGSGLAGLTQLVAILGSSFLFYNLNAQYWGGNMIIESIFGMPAQLIIYTFIFFILGFFIYAFLYGAIGSMASKLEDLNTAVMPVTMIFIAAFIIVMVSMSSGNVDNLLMQVCSYIPLTSPMAMFTRIAMGNVSTLSVMISIVILFASTIGIGWIAAKIYRIGVSMYGTPPKLSSIIKTLKSTK